MKNTIRKFAKKIISSLRVRLFRITRNIATAKGGTLDVNPMFRSQNPENKKIIRLITSIKKGSKQLLSDFELYYLYTLVRKTENIEGSIVEVGVYKGGSAKVICEATNKQVYLFDTFEGLPKPNLEDPAGRFNKGDYQSSYNDVKKYLKKYKNVTIYKGMFPSTSRPIKNKKFSLIHLDVDLYGSTLKCLEFFYTRMKKGGVILCHDYGELKGVKKAVDEFFKNKPEIVIESLAGSSQCLIIKV